MSESAEGKPFPQPKLAPISEPLRIPEDERVNNGRVAFIGGTCFAKWQDPSISPRQQNRGNEHPHITRGDQVLANVKNLLQWGYKVVIIDGGSSEDFQKALKALALEIPNETGHLVVQVEEGQRLAESQRIGYKIASQMAGVEALMVTQPEKPFNKDDMQKFTAPILDNKADVVIPNRTSQLADYPPEQQLYELWGNREMTYVLRQVLEYLELPDRDILPEGIIDIYNGTRIVRNNPRILDALLTKFDETMLPSYAELSEEKKNFFNPEQWFAVLYGPIVRLAIEGYRIASVDTDYKHPAVQTAQETSEPEKYGFDTKRWQQFMAIVPYFYDYAIYLYKQKTKK